MQNLRLEIKEELIKHLNLEDVSVDDIQDETPLFGDGLGLDSIDALEIIVMLDNKFGVVISDPEEGAKIFQNINTIAEFIETQKS